MTTASATKLTPAQRDALERLAQGKSLRGHTHGITINNLCIKRLIEDSDTISEKGRAALAAAIALATPSA